MQKLWVLGVLALMGLAYALGSEGSAGSLESSQEGQRAPRELSITSGQVHLGDQPVEGWPALDLGGLSREWSFQAPAWDGPLTLEIVQQDVHRRWDLRLNGVPVGSLRVATEARSEYLELEAGLLVEGSNTLELALAERPSGPDANMDDVLVGPLTLHLSSFRELFGLRPVTVEVREVGSSRALPARLTLVRSDEPDALDVRIHYGHPTRTSAGASPGDLDDPRGSPSTPTRRSVIYCGPEPLSFEAPMGEYTLYASRGVEWSRARTALTIGPDGAADVCLELERQVDTEGWVACDTHLHTYTFSGHGDASTEERVVTLAAEGIELAIATDHNHQTDYAPTQAALGLNAWFTPVIGNEVTTRNGHFNAFPFEPLETLDTGGRLPDHTLEDWVALVEDIRDAGAQVVILNHPRWPRVDDCPLAFLKYESETGRRARRGAPAFTFDALELVNTTCDTPDPFLLLRDWFGILNGGERVFAVGSSDSHTVGDPVGQGRTYVASASDVAAEIDVEAACAAMRAGRMSTSMGIVATAQARVSGAAEETAWQPMGGLVAPSEQGPVLVRLRVQAPHWVRPREARVYLNGVEAARQAVPAPSPAAAQAATDSYLEFTLPRPWHDAHLICAVVGDEVEEPFWHSLNPYTFAATNPIFIDNGDGRWQSPREVAESVLASLDWAGLTPLDQTDAAVAAQLVALAPENAELAAAVALRHPALADWIASRRVRQESGSGQ